MKKLLAIPGSLREGSYNKSVCRFIRNNPPKDLEVEVFELNNIPMFNEDLEADLPQEVERLIEEIKGATGVIICTPEYNNMLPGVVKNMIEWLSRSYSKPFVQKKPLLIMGGSDGGFGTVRSQNQLYLVASLIGFSVDPSMRLPLSNVDEKIDEKGQIIDEHMKEKITEKVGLFVETLD